jgi:NodT family efflux transporter outer membrane factor (OMF) lipoprotein
VTRLRSAAALVLALAAGACAVGPNYRPPATPAPAAAPFVSATPAIASPDAPPPDWWRLYDDPTLDKLVQEALTENEDLKVAAANLLKARGVLAQARAGLFPSTDLAANDLWGLSSGDQLVDSLTGAPQTPSWFASGGLSVSYEVDLFGRIRRGIQAARADAEATADAENVVRITVAAETARAYADACAFGEQADTAQRSADTDRQVLDLTTRMRDLGARSDFDVASAAAVYDQARAAIPTFEGEARAQLFELAVLTGRPPSEISAAVAACRTPPHIDKPLPVGDGAALLRRRPDVRQAERTLAADTARIGVATADFYPTVSLTGQVATGGGSLKSFVSPASFTYQLGPMITWSFPNVLVAKAEVVQARAQASASIAAFDGVVLNALKETEQSLTSYGAELQRHGALVAARGDNQRAFDLAQIQLQRGSISFPDLLQTERNLESAQADLAASDQALIDDQVAVFQSLGGGWETAPAVTPPKAP